MKAAIVDCTELYANPVRTGIQRVLRRMLALWPAAGPALHLARFDGTALQPIPPRAAALLIDDSPAWPLAELVRLLRETEADPAPTLPARAPALVPELFFDPRRAHFHLERTRSRQLPLAMLLYDFLPFLQPDLCRVRDATPLMAFIRTVRAATHVAHISGKTASDYADRVMHGQAAVRGEVITLGADGLGLARQHWSPQRKAFVVLGSLDGRKNQDVVTAAFIRLWEAGHDIPLVLIGQALPHADNGWLAGAQRYAPFRWLDHVDDATVGRELGQARATVFASVGEGFGLPAVESLHLGVPVVAAPGVPSLTMLPGHGQMPLAEVTVAAVADAVLRLQDDATAAQLWAAAASLRLNTWQDFACDTAAWLRSVPARL